MDGGMLNKLIDYIAHRFNQKPIEKIEDLKLEIDCAEERILDLMFKKDDPEYKYRYFRRGKCKGCLFFSKDEELLKSGQGYCIFNPRPEIVKLDHKCGRIIKR